MRGGGGGSQDPIVPRHSSCGGSRACPYAILKGLTRIGILSDTHGFLDEAIFEHFRECGEIWHAGDIGSLEVLDRLKEFKPLCAVYGNIDDSRMRREVPLDLHWTVEGISVFMTHIGTQPRVRSELRVRTPGLFVCGHSHVLSVSKDAAGCIHINPGACGRQGFHETRTIVRLAIDAGRIFDVEAIVLGPRSSKQK